MKRLTFKYSNITGKIKCNRWIVVMLFVICGVMTKAQNLNSPNKTGPMGTEVNTISGNLFFMRSDVFIRGRQFDLAINFYYNSFLFTEEYGYGKGWTFEYNIKYRHDTIPGPRFILWGDGREDKYDSLPGGGYRSPVGFFNTLTRYQPGKYVLAQQDGTKYYFDNPVHKRITKIEERNGNFINFSYTDSLLTSMVNASGQSISFTYNSQGRLATVVDAIGTPTRTFTYSYDASGNLKEVKYPSNTTYQYEYLVNGPMKSMADRNGNKIDIIYYPDFAAREIIGCNKRLSFSYDTTSKTTIVTDHLSNGNQVTKYVYEERDNATWIKSMSGNCCGFNVSFEYDEQGNRTKMTDANGKGYTYTYDAFGNMLTSTDPLGQTRSYTYTTDFRKISSYRDTKGNLYTMTYDADGNMVQLKAPGNVVYTATYNAAGDMTSCTDGKGNVFTYSYDTWGNLVSATGPNGYHAALSFDARGNLLSSTDARGNGYTAEYDILDRIKKVTDPFNNSVQFTLDAEGNVISKKNKNGETSTFSYDASNRLVIAAGPTGNQTLFSYDGMDNLLSFRNALGNETTLSYDNRNRVKGIKDAEGNNVLYNYDGNGNITSASLATGQSFNYTYDALNRVTSINDTKGIVAGYAYDENGNVTKYINPTGAITSALYDSLNRVKQITDPLGNSVLYTYDKDDNLTSVTDREGHTTFYTYDSLNRVKTHTDRNGFVVTVGYDAAGNVVSLTDQNNNTTGYTYDSLNRRKRVTYPDGKYDEYSYDKKGNIVQLKRTDGTSILYQFDTLNRVISRTLPGGEINSYVYDKLGRVISATNNNGTVLLEYDKLNRVVSESFDGRTVKYNYNIAGRTQTTIYPDSTIVTKEFDTRNRLVKISKDAVTLVEYAYNNADQLTGKTFANGISSSMQYDFANRLSNINTSGGAVQNSSFTYDKQFNKTAITRLNNPSHSEQFSYDNDYRLTEYKRGPAGSPVLQNTYSYDAAGNRIATNLDGAATTYTTNNLNQLIGVNGVNFIFDDRGNITYDGRFYKTYTADNKLIKDSSSPGNVITYGYDALNRRVTKTVNGSLLKYTYSYTTQIEERSSGNQLLNRTIFNNFLSPLMNEKGGNKFFYHSNEVGSVEAITNSNGKLVESYRYDVYGKPARFDSLNNPLASSIAGNRFGFTGQEYDSATGNYRFFYRYYSPETGVFNQRDLIEYGDGMGMYQYVHNNPANGVDVWGLDDIDDQYELPPGYSYPVRGMYDGNDPCYHDKKKIKLVTKWEIRRTKELMKEHLKKFGNGLMGDYEGIGSADSRYYTELLQNQFASGDEMYFFHGQPMHNYEANYYFTGYAAGQRGYGSDFAQTASRGWNAAKGVGDALTGDGLGRLASTLDPFEIRTSMMDEGTVDGQIENKTGTESLPNYTDMGDNMQAFDNKVVPDFGEWWPVINPKTGEIGYEFFPNLRIKSEKVLAFRKYVKEHCQEDGGTKKRFKLVWSTEKNMWVIISLDPNEIIGPQGQPSKKWVSVKDRMSYTILCENAKAATAPAKYIRISTPVEPKQDPSSFQLSGFGFNNQDFTIPGNPSSYYKRLDCRDSMGLYVDVVAGYDQVRNEIFWEFQSIDPVTQLPTEDPLKGLLFLQDSTQPAYGHGYVTFTIKPRPNSITLDTIGARGKIVFDNNDTIPTNIYTNTIDAFAPVSHINDLPDFTPNTAVVINYSGADDAGGCGLKSYSIYVSDNNGAPQLYAAGLTRTDTTFYGLADHTYKFYLSAVDSVGNVEELKLLDSVRITSGEQVICPNGNITFDAKSTGGIYQWQADNGTGFTNISNGGIYGGATTSVLSLTNAPSSMYGYQYRCLINGSPSAEIFLLKFAMTWEGSVSNAWENPANWSCGSLPDGNTDVIVNGGKANYPVVNSQVTIRTLRMNPGASGTVNPGFNMTILK